MDKYGVILMMETSESELNDLSSDLPTDTHLVRYVASRATFLAMQCVPTKVDIFDCYHTWGFAPWTSSQDSGPSSPSCSKTPLKS